MKKLLLTFIMIFSLLLYARAQDYNTGIGLRGGLYNGITIKHFVNRHSAFEGLVFTRWHGLGITLLYEKQYSFLDIKRLNWYFGFGGHAGFFDTNYYPDSNSGTSITTIGADAILGIEYNFKVVPINLSLDWKPALNLIGDSRFWGDGGAFSIRFIF